MPRVTICVYANLYNSYKQKNGGMNMQLESTDTTSSWYIQKISQW